MRNSVRDLFLSTIGSAVLLILLVFYSLIFIVIRRSYIHTANQTTDIVIEETESQIRHFFLDIERTTRWLAESSFIKKYDHKMMGEIFFSLAHSHSNYISSVYFGDKYGRFLQRGWSSLTFTTNQGWAYSRIPYDPGVPGLLPATYDPRLRPWYHSAVSNQGFIFTAPYPFITQNQTEKNLGITAAAPVYDKNGTVMGVIGIDNSLMVLSQWMEKIKLPGKGKAILVDINGNILYWPYKSQSPAKVLPALFNSSGFKGLPALKGRMNIRVEKKPMILSYKTSDSAGLIIIALFDIQNLMAPGIRAILITLFITLILAVILGFILRLQVTDLTSPLIALEKAMKNFQNNNSIPLAIVPEKFRLNEIGRLETAFREMSSSIIKYENDLIRQFYYESLTGLPNRKKLLEDIKEAEHAVLILINIDGFKEINDFYGHVIGDFVIKMAAERLQNAISSGTRLYKLPSDEFAILITQTRKAWEVQKEALNLSTRMCELPVIYAEQEIYLQVTMGAARGNNIQKSITLMVQADMALKKAKKQFKHYLLYHDSMEIRKEYETNLSMSKKLRIALENNGIIPYFQPIMNNLSGNIEKYECLVRMRDTNGEILTPDKFLGIARKSRQYLPITRIMIEKSFERFNHTSYDFSINLSQEDVRSTVNHQYIIHMLERHPELSKRVVFEFLESDSIDNYEQVQDFIKELRKYGARIAIDDFGTGYSNFEHILELKPDYLKLDASLIKNLHEDNNSRLIVETISEFAHKISLSTIAEYVHCQEVMDVEKRLHIDFSQGFFIGKPSPDLRSK